MRAAQLQAFGRPEDVVECVELPDPAPPGPGQVSADIEAFPLNPADLHQCQGTYAVRPPLPALIGAESVGRITAVGPGVTNRKIGDRIIFRNRENWVQKRTVDVKQTVLLPAGFQGDIDDRLILEAAMLKVNPATALMMLRDYVVPKPGEWVIQDAANSSVGTHVNMLAAANGWRVINVVRSESAAQYVRDIGGGNILMDGDDVPAQAREIAGEHRIGLAIDSVGGQSARCLMNALSDGGTLVAVGRISGQPMVLDSSNLIASGKIAAGFWLTRGLGKRTDAEVEALYGDLAQAVLDRRLATRVEATYPITRIKDALVHAHQGGRSGKILVRPQQT